MKAKKYAIYYYNAEQPLLPIGIQIEWGPELNLEYPTLTGSAGRPFVLFKAVTLEELNNGGTVNPAIQLGDELALANEKVLVKDSIVQQANLENRDTVHVQNENNEVKLYPNPTNNYVNLEIRNWRENSFYYIISNSMGQVMVNNVLIKEKLTRIDISKFQKGVYQIEVISKDKVINLQMIVL